jgi:hypothetical protein
VTPAELAAQALIGLGTSALELMPSFCEAIKANDKQEARDISEEMLRRQAFEERQRAKRPKGKG